MKIKLQGVALAILLVISFSAFAQENKPKNRHISDNYKISFEMPDGAVKLPESTESRTVFVGDGRKFGAASRFEFRVSEMKGVEAFARQISTDEGAGVVADNFIKKIKEKQIDLETIVLEKKRIQLAGQNAVKIVFSSVTANGKLRSAMITVPVPEHQRMYHFIVLAADEDFGKWFSVSEASIMTFALSKAE